MSHSAQQFTFAQATVRQAHLAIEGGIQTTSDIVQVAVNAIKAGKNDEEAQQAVLNQMIPGKNPNY